MVEHAPVDLDLIEAHAGGIGNADVIFVFGTLHPTPAHVAAHHYRLGHSQVVVVTGGTSRARPGHDEARRHREVLLARGVPESAIVVESRSQSTYENVTMAMPLVLDRVGDLRTVLAVVKWFHRRALVTLAHHVPTIERIFAATYEPYDPVTGKLLLRTTWERTSPLSVARETNYMRAMIAAGFDPLVRDTSGWVRSVTAQRH
jgi:uncharacterized SAM-binding protein YcdF (DUF218 family)